MGGLSLTSARNDYLLPASTRFHDAKEEQAMGRAPSPECEAENVVIVDTLQQIEGRCNGCGKDVVFVHHLEAVPRVIERLREHRPYDPMIPGGR
jgi:hypothetical protein